MKGELSNSGRDPRTTPSTPREKTRMRLEGPSSQLETFPGSQEEQKPHPAKKEPKKNPKPAKGLRIIKTSLNSLHALGVTHQIAWRTELKRDW